MNPIKKISQKAGIALVIKIASAGMAFGLHVTVARELGPVLSGEFFLGYSIVIIAATVSRMGMDNASVRFVAELNAESEFSLIGLIYKYVVIAAFLVSAFMGIVIWVSADVLSQTVFSGSIGAETLRVFGFSVVPVAIFTLQARCLQGLKKTSISLIVLNLITPLVTVILLVMAPFEMDSYWAGSSFLVAGFISAIIGHISWNFYRKNMLRGRASREERSYAEVRRSFISASKNMLVVSIASIVVMWVPNLYVGIIEDPAGVALFNAANRASMLIAFILVAANAVASPRFAELFRKNCTDELKDLAIGFTRYCVILAGPIAVIFWIWADKIMAIFGPEFVAGADLLRVLVIGQFVNVSTGVVGALLLMTGIEREYKWLLVGSAVVINGLCWGLIPSFGIEGAAWSQAIVVAGQNIGAVWLVKKRSGINVFRA